MTDPTPRELALVEAALKAAANLCELRPIHAAPLVASPIRSLDPAAIVASVPRKLDPELKAALEQAAKTGDLHVALPNGGVVFINRGEQPEDTSDLDCPYCGGSGHNGDVASVPQPAEQLEDERLSLAVIEHLGPAALSGGKMSVLDAFTLGWQAAKRDALTQAPQEQVGPTDMEIGPSYYVRHPDDSYSLADPQPTVRKP